MHMHQGSFPNDGIDTPLELTTSGPTFEKDMPADSVVAFQEKKYFGLSKRRLALVAVRLSYCVFQSLTLVEICSLSYEANKIYIIISISCREQL